MGHHFWLWATTRRTRCYYLVFLNWSTILSQISLWRFACGLYSVWALGEDPEDLGSTKMLFFLWLVAHKKCWTADRLARHGIDHPDCCPFCDQEEESIDHLLVNLLIIFWFTSFTRLVCRFYPHSQEWFPFMMMAGCKQCNKWLTTSRHQFLHCLRSLVSMEASQSMCFWWASPSLAGILKSPGEERELWEMAGARGLSLLAIPIPGVSLHPVCVVDRPFVTVANVI